MCDVTNAFTSDFIVLSTFYHHSLEKKYFKSWLTTWMSGWVFAFTQTSPSFSHCVLSRWHENRSIIANYNISTSPNSACHFKSSNQSNHFIKASQTWKVEDNASQSKWQTDARKESQSTENAIVKNSLFSPVDYVNITRSGLKTSLIMSVWFDGGVISISLRVTHLTSKANQLCLIITA